MALRVPDDLDIVDLVEVLLADDFAARDFDKPHTRRSVRQLRRPRAEHVLRRRPRELDDTGSGEGLLVQ